MDSLINLKQILVSQIQHFEPNKNANNFAVLHGHMSGNISLLSWLKAQVIYPQFYYHFREQNKIMATIGETKKFTNQQQACDFSQHLPIPLVGGVQFNGDAYFILPRLVLTLENSEIFVQLTIDQTQPWEQEKALLLQTLDRFCQMSVIQDINQSIQFYRQSANQDTWCHWVEQALNAIEEGQFNKVVLANDSFYRSDKAINPYDFLAKSEKYNQGCYHFLFSQNADETFLGSTPERLYLRQQHHLQTEALAGTAKHSDDEQENKKQANWLLNDEKNIYENTLVAKDIADNMQPYLKDIHIGERKIKALRQVQHLKRLIHITLNEKVDDNNCLNAIHPTAAVAGLPKAKALKFLQENELFERRWYAGTLGILSKNYAEFCVTIRSAVIKQNIIQVFAGAGIVAGSIPLLEWQEIERKASGLISLLQQTKQRESYVC